MYISRCGNRVRIIYGVQYRSLHKERLTCPEQSNELTGFQLLRVQKKHTIPCNKEGWPRARKTRCTSCNGSRSLCATLPWNARRKQTVFSYAVKFEERISSANRSFGSSCTGSRSPRKTYSKSGLLSCFPVISSYMLDFQNSLAWHRSRGWRQAIEQPESSSWPKQNHTNI